MRHTADAADLTAIVSGGLMREMINVRSTSLRCFDV